MDGAFPPSLRYGATSSSAVAVHVADRRWLNFPRYRRFLFDFAAATSGAVIFS